MSNRSILLVDDNKTFTDVFIDCFLSCNDSDFEITGVANNGLKAIEMIYLLHPDFVLLDISMPYYSGYNVLENIALMKLDKKPQVIMLTGMSANDSVEESLKRGAVGFIEKPFGMNKVISLLSQL